jgi:hypothetical protein
LEQKTPNVNVIVEADWPKNHQILKGTMNYAEFQLAKQGKL